MIVIDLKTGENIKITDEMSLKCAIGNFDGVHLGHKELLSIASEKSVGITHSAVWTFRTHPGICRKIPKTKILTSLEQKLSLFSKNGIDIAILYDFNEVCDIPPEEFSKNIIVGSCRIKTLVCGFNFRFGKGASGTPEALRDYLSPLGSSLISVPEYKLDGITVSSSLIRRYIEDGDIVNANRFLGHPFEIFLPVSEGRKIGRRIGIPTINQVFPQNHAIPRHGVYACICEIDGKKYPSISNVGLRPTVTEHAENVNCETHIIGFDGWLYGKTVPVHFYRFLRDEKRFPSLEALKNAIHSDISEVVSFFADKDISSL